MSAKKNEPPPWQPEPLTEATITLADGQTVMKWLNEVEETVIKAVAAVLPPAKASDRGTYPEQWVRMVDCSPTEALVCISRWDGDGAGKAYYRVAFTSNESGEITTGAVTATDVEWKMVLVPLDGDEPKGDADAMIESADLSALYRKASRYLATTPARRDLIESERERARLDSELIGAIDANFVEAKKVKLVEILEDMRAVAIGTARKALSLSEPEATSLAALVLENVSGRHPLATRLAIDLSEARAK